MKKVMKSLMEFLTGAVLAAEIMLFTDLFSAFSGNALSGKWFVLMYLMMALLLWQCTKRYRKMTAWATGILTAVTAAPVSQ